jgi:hypothetical protein
LTRDLFNLPAYLLSGGCAHGIIVIDVSCRGLGDWTALLLMSTGAWRESFCERLWTAAGLIAATLAVRGLRPGVRTMLLAPFFL